MYLTKQENEKLLLLFAAEIAGRRKQKGLALNYPETISYFCGHIIEGAREGKTVNQLIEECNHLLTADQVMPGVANLLVDMQVEATFPDGTKLVSLQRPIPINENDVAPGAYEFADEDIELLPNRERMTIKVVNSADRPVQVGSHYHFYETNPALIFDRQPTLGYRLDIASGLSTRFLPGEEQIVNLVKYGGTQEIYGFTGKVNAAL
ncbi:urease subunit gamma [Flavobacterium sp. NKUCC04_CG]|uniref:urease subunit gamma n=1 Tax=Flavobacterium sp. NKUCC04_CG TaxID=2842121 RepID=UPI001C5A9D78|nr:urease subunit gamma [Flavobacterium sp. NKUCC04_CG]MBW3518539.1 urease subunit gamma [Flavobacterium sp. NKUCC04_CG]